MKEDGEGENGSKRGYCHHTYVSRQEDAELEIPPENSREQATGSAPHTYMFTLNT